MKLADFTRLKKFMAMTMSENEHEASAAIKMANTILIQNHLTWARVLDRSVKVVQEVEAAPESYDDSERTNPDAGNPHRHGARPATPTRAARDDGPTYDVSEIEEAISIIERKGNLKGNFEDVIDSIAAQHRQGKKLSFKQRELLFRVARQ